MPKNTSDLLDIDMHALHDECVRQPRLYHEWAEALAQADAESDRLKGALKLTEAQVSDQIRRSPEKFGLSKATDASVAAAVILSPKYQESLHSFNAAEAEVGTLKAMVTALGQRKDSIEALVRLRLADYFADPRLPQGEMEAASVSRMRRTAGDTPDPPKRKR